MTSAGLHDARKKDVPYPRRKHNETRSRIAENIAYVVLGIVLYAGWHCFGSLEFISDTPGLNPGEHRMPGAFKAALLLAVASVPLAVHFILRHREHRIPRSETR